MRRLAVLVGLVVPAACSSSPALPYLGPPGTSVTHAVVDVQRGTMAGEVWRLRSVVTVGEATDEALLPAETPREPLTLPATYKVLARGRRGTISVRVDALDRGGQVVGRGRGSTQLVEDAGVTLDVVLDTACEEAESCDDGVYCNGAERCVDGVCTPGEVACPPSVNACVEVACKESGRSCDIRLHDDRCDLPGDGDVYCDARLGCVAGLPGAPALSGAVTVTPSVGRLGTVFTVSFAVTEPLGPAPVVTVDVGPRLASLVMDPAASQPQTRQWVYLYVVDGSEVPGTHPVSVALEDLSGTRADGLSGGTLTVDFSAPALARCDVTPPAVRAGVPAAASVLMNETVASPVTVRMAPSGRPVDTTSPAWVAPAEPGGPFSFIPTGSEEEGSWDVAVFASDEAGNAAGPLPCGALVLDFTAPSVGDDPLVRPTRAATGRNVFVEVVSTESPAGTVALSGVGPTASFDFPVPSVLGRVLTFNTTLEVGLDGPYSLVLAGLEDAAGNRAQDVVVGHLVVDNQRPSLVSASVTPAAARPTDVLWAQFTVDEGLDRPPQVSLDTSDFVLNDETDGTYVYALSQEGTARDGDYTVTAYLVDVAGNTASVPVGRVRLDSVPPVLLAVDFNPRVARLGSTVVFSMTASEPLGEPPVLEWEGGRAPPLGPVTVSGLTWTASWSVANGTADGTYRLAGVAFRDQAGNSVATAPPHDVTVTVDGSPPVILAAVPSRPVFSAVAPFNVLQVTVTLGSAGTVTAQLGGSGMDCTGGGLAWTCVRQVGSGDGEGIALVRVVAEDDAGNADNDAVAVRVDKTAPWVEPGSVSLRLVPGAGNPLTSVTAMKAGTRAVVSFLASESLTGPPTVTDVEGGLVAEALDRTGTLHSFDLLVGPNTAEGIHHVRVLLEDLVGNTADVALSLPAPGLRVMLTPPPPPDTETAGRIRLVRMPWGAGSTPVPVTQVSGQAGAVRPDCGVLVLIKQSQEAGRTLDVQSDGSFGPVALSFGDHVNVWVSSVDGAGNVSEPAKVRDGTWVASLVGKVTGDDVGNPASAEAHGALANRLFPSATFRRVDEDVATHDARVAEARGAGQWTNVTRAWSPPVAGPLQAFAAHDSARGRTLAFGWFYLDMAADRLATWDGRTWKEPTPQDPEGDGNPNPVETGGLVYDPRRDVAVLLDSMRAETWEWNGSSWRLVLDTGLQPIGEADPMVVVMAYDEGVGRVVMWDLRAEVMRAWDGATWSAQVPLDPEGDGNPTDWYAGSMAYDTARQRLVLVHDVGGPSPWEWTGTSWQKMPLSDPEGDGNPAGHQPGVAAYDPETGRVVVFSRQAGTQEKHGLWSWDGSSWAYLEPAESGGPLVTAGNLLLWDGTRGELLLITSDAQNRLATWSWSAGSWRQVFWTNPDAVPLVAVTMMGSAYDLLRQRMVGYGGLQGLFSDEAVWEWDGLSWVPYWEDAPGTVMGPGMAFDGDQGLTVMFGGGIQAGARQDVLWTWDGVGWAQSVRGDPWSSPYKDTALAHDAARHVVVMVAEGHATWEYDGTAWHQGPDWPGTGHVALVYDPVAARVRGVRPGAVGTWDGTSWSSQAVTGGPSGAYWMDADWDAERSKIVVVEPGSGRETIPWEWDGTDWVPRDVADAENDGNPSERIYATMVYDVARGRVVMAGGSIAHIVLTGETWEWYGGAQDRPAVVARFPTNQAAVDRGWLTGLTVDVTAGGGPVPGFLLLSWQDNGWETVALETREDLRSLRWDTTDVATLRRAMVRDTVHVAVTSRAPNGTGTAQVQLDAVELRLHYRLP
jgi:hypothetical protein